MAYATIADLPVEVGLYTCMVPMVVYAAAWRLAHDVGEHDVDRGTAHRVDADRRRRRRRGNGPDWRPGDAHPARRADPARRPLAASRGADRQHLRGDVDRDQGRRRAHRRRRPASQAARHRGRPRRRELLRRGRRHRRRPRRRELDHGGVLGRNPRRAARRRASSFRNCLRRCSPSPSASSSSTWRRSTNTGSP